MNIIGLIIIPIFFLLNSYLIGKLFQKTGRSITNFFSFSMGFIFLILLLSIVTIPFYILADIASIYPYTLLGLQVILFLIYIFNIKQLIFSFLFNWHKFLLFIVTISISLIFWSVLLYLKNINVEVAITNDSIFDYFHFSIFKIFNFSKLDINRYLVISLPITLAFPLSTALCHSYQFMGKVKFVNIIFYVLIVSFFSILTFLKIEFISSFLSFFIICLPIVYYYFFNNTLKKYTNSYYFYINIFLFYLIFLNRNFLFISCLFALFYSISTYCKRQYLESGKIWQVFIYLIGVFAIFFLKIDIIISMIILFVFAASLTFYLLYKRNKKYYLHQFIVEKYLSNKLQWFIFACVIILTGSIVVSLLQNNYVFNTSLFLIDSPTITYTNISTWIVYGFLTFFSFTYFFYSLLNREKYDNEWAFISYIYALLFNPLSMSVLSQITYISNGTLIISNEWFWLILFSITLFFFYNKIIKFPYNYLFSKKDIQNYNYKNVSICKQISYMLIFFVVFFTTSASMFIIGDLQV